MFLQTLKNELVQQLSTYYNESSDSFVGICSKRLPEIQKFLEFWEETTIIDESEMNFEIDEIVILFRRWCSNNNESATTLNDTQILDLISYFYPTLEIERDKYISHIRNRLWDKQVDIQVAMENMRIGIREKQTTSSRNNISIYDAYRYYCKYYTTQKSNVNRLIVSKAYFDKFIMESLSNYIVDSKFLSWEWYTA
jgi:hypothetical protein